MLSDIQRQLPNGDPLSGTDILRPLAVRKGNLRNLTASFADIDEVADLIAAGQVDRMALSQLLMEIRD